MMFIHTNHPHHRDGALRIAAPRKPRRVARAAVATWNAHDIEEAINTGGGVGGVTRSPKNGTPIHTHRRRSPAVDRHRENRRSAGTAFAERRPALSGVRVLDLTRVLAGPTSGRVMAENGADVLHIAAPHLPYQTEILMDTGHGKRCAWLDLSNPAGIATMKGLLREADIFTQGYRPALSPHAASHPNRWLPFDPASSASASAPMATKVRGRIGAASIRSCRTSAGLPPRKARSRLRAICRSRRSIISAAISRHSAPWWRSPDGSSRRLVAGSRVAGPGGALAGDPRHGRCGAGAKELPEAELAACSWRATARSAAAALETGGIAE